MQRYPYSLNMNHCDHRGIPLEVLDYAKRFRVGILVDDAKKDHYLLQDEKGRNFETFREFEKRI